jgi:hypothetical protein
MIKLQGDCIRGEEDCEAYALIVSDCKESFVCCGENDGTRRKVEQDKYTFCFKNAEIDEMSHYDEVDLADQMSVIAQSLSIINHVKANEECT